jgi:hypothetical protein
MENTEWEIAPLGSESTPLRKAKSRPHMKAEPSENARL